MPIVGGSVSKATCKCSDSGERPNHGGRIFRPSKLSVQFCRAEAHGPEQPREPAKQRASFGELLSSLGNGCVQHPDSRKKQRWEGLIHELRRKGPVEEFRVDTLPIVVRVGNSSWVSAYPAK
jgi:hypothetical protein